LKKTHHKKGGVAQGVGPKFKLQCQGVVGKQCPKTKVKVNVFILSNKVKMFRYVEKWLHL
jgi:hypothetical protein